MYSCFPATGQPSQEGPSWFRKQGTELSSVSLLSFSFSVFPFCFRFLTVSLVLSGVSQKFSDVLVVLVCSGMLLGVFRGFSKRVWDHWCFSRVIFGLHTPDWFFQFLFSFLSFYFFCFYSFRPFSIFLSFFSVFILLAVDGVRIPVESNHVSHVFSRS
jgi:hypothetical protein